MKAVFDGRNGMRDLDMEQAHLVKADRHIAEGERRVAQQVELVDRARRDSRADSSGAEQLLETLTQTLQTWRDHRATILRTIADIRSGALPSASIPERPPAGVANGLNLESNGR